MQKCNIHLDLEIIKENCKFTLYYDKTDISPTVLYGGNEIILALWPNDRHIICSINNDIPAKISSHPYALVNRSVLCNCGIEVENNFLLKSLAAFHDANSKLVMHFTLNATFVNNLDQIDNLTESHEFPILKNMTTFEQTLLISLNISKFDASLLTAAMTLKDILHQYKCNKENFDLEERHDSTDECLPNNNFFSNNFIVDVFCLLLQ